MCARVREGVKAVVPYSRVTDLEPLPTRRVSNKVLGAAPSGGVSTPTALDVLFQL